MLSVVALLLPAAISAAAADKPPTGPAPLISTVAQRLRRLGNVSATYRDVIDSRATINPRLWKLLQEKMRRKYGLLLGPESHGRYVSARRFSYLHGCALYQFRLLPQTIAKVPPLTIGDWKVIKTYTPERSESLRYALHGKFPIGGIEARDSLPWSVMDVALGLRGAGSDHWLRPSDVKKMQLMRLAGGSFTLAQDNRGAYDYRWTFRQKPHLELVSVAASMKGKQLIAIRCSNFRNVDGLWLPEHIKETSRPLGYGRRISQTVSITHVVYTVGSRWNTPNRYLILFPQGSAVLDERIGQSFRIESRPRRLTDKAIFHLLVKWDGGWHKKGGPHR